MTTTIINWGHLSLPVESNTTKNIAYEWQQLKSQIKLKQAINKHSKTQQSISRIKV